MGKYVNNNLIRGEQVEYEARYHWIIFFNARAIFSLFLAPVIDKKTHEFVITNKRIIIKTGLIRRNTFEMNLKKIESVKVEQSVFERILGYGTIIIIGSGGSLKMISKIRKPLEFRKRFQELV